MKVVKVTEPDYTPKFIQNESEKDWNKLQNMLSFTAMQRFRTGAVKNLTEDKQKINLAMGKSATNVTEKEQKDELLIFS